jgi:hypothetical protein
LAARLERRYVDVTVKSFQDALRPTAVVAELTRAVPEFADGGLALLGCRISRIRSVPGQDVWTAVYELDVRNADNGRAQTLVAKGMLTPPGLALPDQVDTVPFGSAGWSLAVPSLRLHLAAVANDDALPGLDVITDPVQGRRLLGECMRAGGILRPGADVTAYVPSVVTHKPGVRATVLCQLEYDDRGTTAPVAVVVKVHHDDQGERAFQAMRGLSDSSGRQTALAQPIAYLPGLRLSIQEYIEHRYSFKELFYSQFHGDTETWDELLDATRATAAGLAGLHRSGYTGGESVRWDQELATLRAKQDNLTTVMPTLRRIGSVPDRLASAAATIAADPLAPAHHSFRPAQVLLTDNGVAFIDFDKFCRAEPASDIALFTAKLQHMAVNKVTTQALRLSHDAKLAQLRTTFLEEYRRHTPVTEGRVALWEALELTSLVLSAAKKVNETWVDSCHRMLEEHLAARGW